MGAETSMMQKKMPTTRSDELRPDGGGSGRNPQEPALGASNITAFDDKPNPREAELMERVVARENMLLACQRVVSNKGAAGIDKMSVDELAPYLVKHWEQIKEELLTESYKPQAVRSVSIPKQSGGMRKLGIPTIIDRLIQQALHQVLSPYFEPGFSESSYGFRPGKSAHQAIQKARMHVQQGKRFVVDIDLEQFFDRVNHDVLMSRVARKIKDKRVLRLVRKYLQTGVMTEGVVSPQGEGTPQGSPLSPLLSNILLDDLDKELEGRGHAFVRYADDCNIYVASKTAGQRVMESVTKYLDKHLRLQVNRHKSAVDRVWQRKFLGYTMTWDKTPRLRVAKSSVKRLKDKVRAIFKASRGRKLKRTIDELSTLLRGWMQYFHLARVKKEFEELDRWIRRKLRCIQWKQWKRPRTRMRELIARGLSKEKAWKGANNGRGKWYNASAAHMNFALPNSFFDAEGLVSLLNRDYALEKAKGTCWV